MKAQMAEGLRPNLAGDVHVTYVTSTASLAAKLSRLVVLAHPRMPAPKV